MRPQVSALIPVHNGAHWVANAVRSVQRQTFRDIQVVVVDDHSTDETPRVVAEIARDDTRVEYFESDGEQGLVSALNFGLERCRAPLVARLDCDDLMDANRLARQVVLFENRRLILVGSNIQHIDEHGHELTRSYLPCKSSNIVKWLESGRSPFAHPAVTFRRSAVIVVGGYDPSFQHAEDFELWCRLHQRGQMTNLPGLLTRYRVHNAQVSRIQAHAQQLSTLRATRHHFPDASKLLGFIRNGALNDVDLDVLSSILRGTSPDGDSQVDVRAELAHLARLVSGYRARRRVLSLDLVRHSVHDPRLTLLALVRALPYIRRTAIHALTQ